MKAIRVLTMGVLVLNLAGSALAGEILVVDWSGSLDIPDRGEYAESYLVSSAPPGAYITALFYEVVVDDLGNSNFWCSDYEIGLSSDAHGGPANYHLVWDNAGGQTDGNADDDALNDSDIELSRNTTAFNGESPDQSWYVCIKDNISFHPVLPPQNGLGCVKHIKLIIQYEAPTVQVPNIVGMTQADAQSAISTASLVVGTITQASSDIVRQGNVISQSPAAGTSVPIGTVVDLVISSGPSVGPGVGGLVAHWKLDEASGNIAEDSSGYGNNGILYGSPQWIAGKIDGALQFDGVDDSVDCGSAASLDITGLITLAAWVKTEDSGDGKTHEYIVKGHRTYALRHQQDNVMEFMIFDGLNFYNARYSVDSSFNGVWHHLAGTYDGSQLKLYVDGQLETSSNHVGSPYVGSIASSTVHVGIGSNMSDSSLHYTGIIDDARIYNYVLPQDAISELAGAAKADPNLVGWWKLDETSGNIAADSSGYANDGILFGGPQWVAGKIGSALQFDGRDDYVRLPIDSLISSLTDCTISTWANWSGTGGYWQRIFDFGSSTTNCMFLTPTGGTSLRFAIKKTDAGLESILDAPSNLTTGWHHIAVMINGTTKVMQLYIDGSIITTATTQTLPKDLGNTTQNWLGKSQYGDPLYKGSLDDFRIYNRVLSPAEIAQLAGITAGDTRLVGWWKLDETSGTIAYDSAGTKHGTLYGGPVWQPTGGKINGALQFDGSNDYVSLPIGSLISSLTNSTFATWVNWSGTGGDWQRIFDFGSGTNVNMFLTPRNGTTGTMRFAITTGGAGSEDRTTAPQALSIGWHHVAITIDAVNKKHTLYLDGSVVAQKTAASYTPSSLSNTTQNWLGRSQYPDPYFNGSLDDFRIYNGILGLNEITQLWADGMVAH